MGWLSILAQQHGDSEISCRWVIGGGGSAMASAIVFLVMWLKAVLKELSDEKAGRLNDFKEQYRDVKDDR